MCVLQMQAAKANRQAFIQVKVENKNKKEKERFPKFSNIRACFSEVPTAEQRGVAGTGVIGGVGGCEGGIVTRRTKQSFSGGARIM